MGSQQAVIHGDLRARIISDPDVILSDRALMQALVLASDSAVGDNVVDLRGVAMERLESRLDRLEETHRSVIAAAYDNLAGTNQVHRAILKMLDPTEFEAFLTGLGTDVADILRVDSIRLVLETQSSKTDECLTRVGEVLRTAPEGFVEGYVTRGRPLPVRQVTLRQTGPAEERMHGDWVRSEACLHLDFGEGRLPGMLVMGSEDPHQFLPNHGTDLLGFMASVFERSMRRWLA